MFVPLTVYPTPAPLQNFAGVFVAYCLKNSTDISSLAFRWVQSTLLSRFQNTIFLRGRVLRDGNDIPPAQLGKDGLLGSATDLESLYAHYRGGATIVLQFLHERWKGAHPILHGASRQLEASAPR